jgi:arylsulfatase A-like enzyme
VGGEERVGEMRGRITRRHLIAAGMGAVLSGTVAGSAGARPYRPNVLVVVADDLGWADLGCYGSPHIRTPRLDGLAAEGVRFTAAYAAAPVCSPTRFALYTGRYPGRLEGGLQEPISRPDERHGIPPPHPTLASLLKQVGYTTAMVGKWHCGFLPWFGPTRSGWDTFFGNFGGAVDYYSKLTARGPDLYEGESPVEVPGYYTDLIADRAAAFVRADHPGPWLLNVNFTAPHWPWEAPGDLAVSRDLTDRLRAGDRQALNHPGGGSPETFGRMVEAMDAGIGRLLDALRESGAERDTIVLFAGDNGGERWSYQRPLRGNKGSLNEGGIRVPTVLRWPARIPPGQVSEVPTITQDWTATLVELAGARPAPAYAFDGASLVPHLLHAAPPPGRDLFWRTRSAGALRRGRWKLLRSGSAPDALYDVVADPGEGADLAGRHPDVAAELAARWEAVAADLLPYQRPPGRGRRRGS